MGRYGWVMTRSSPTPESLKRDLSDLAAHAGAADRSAEEIRTAAADRREAVTSRLAELRTKAITEDGAAKEYQDLVSERGRLDLALAHGG